MATTPNLNSIFEALPAISKLQSLEKHGKKAKVTCSFKKKENEIQESLLHTTRRLAIGLASVAIFGNASIGKSLADDNGYWLTTPLPVPFANNRMLLS